ncbi:hypothetical protein DCS_04729 [Drechmeria coniospora]|uniref:Uncharacterized protein n=1 Tax=Drechmeria coniospora TaxID=98403 RepID=A0A151GKV0_DRECN|nr:hypothetical protein DCS_04729 [Drechmeria coniospora]KYK57716.1 hypothetical protein DCS_04729 [Drechmeria coniospora]
MGGSMLGIHPQPRPEAETQFVTILPQDQSIDEEESIIYDFDTSFTMLIQVKSSVNGFFLLQRLDGGSPRLAEDIGQCGKKYYAVGTMNHNYAESNGLLEQAMYNTITSTASEKAKPTADGTTWKQQLPSSPTYPDQVIGPWFWNR